MPVVTHQLFETYSDKTQNISSVPLLKEGPFLEVFIAIPQALAEYNTKENIPLPPPVSGIALIDTGASKSCVHGPVMKELRVSPIGVAPTHTAAGTVHHSLYPAHFTFPSAKLEIDFTSVVGADLSGQLVAGKQLLALIGRDVLSMGVFFYNGQTSTFSFAI